MIAGFRLFDDPDSVAQMLRRLAQSAPMISLAARRFNSIAVRKGDVIRRVANALEIETLAGKDGSWMHRLEAQRLIRNGSPEESSSKRRLDWRRPRKINRPIR